MISSRLPRTRQRCCRRGTPLARQSPPPCSGERCMSLYMCPLHYACTAHFLEQRCRQTAAPCHKLCTAAGIKPATLQEDYRGRGGAAAGAVCRKPGGPQRSCGRGGLQQQQRRPCGRQGQGRSGGEWQGSGGGGWQACQGSGGGGGGRRRQGGSWQEGEGRGRRRQGSEGA